MAGQEAADTAKQLQDEVHDLKQQLASLQAQMAALLASQKGNELPATSTVLPPRPPPQPIPAPVTARSIRLPSQDGFSASGSAPGVPMAATRVVMHQIVMPSEVDRLGICFGGQVLSWIDVCAGMSAKTLAKGPCVTATLDAVHFLRPCRLGTVVIIAAMVNRTFNSSMEVGVRVEAEDMRTGVRHHCCSAYLTFVTVTQKGVPHRASLSGSHMYPANNNANTTNNNSNTNNDNNASNTSNTTNTNSNTNNNNNNNNASNNSHNNHNTAGSAALLAGLHGHHLTTSTKSLAASGTTAAVPQGIPTHPPVDPPNTGLSSAAQSAALLPRVLPTTPEHVRVHQEAEARRRARLAERQRRRNDPDLAKQAEMCRLRPVTHREGGAWLPASIQSPWVTETNVQDNGKQLTVSIPRVMSMNTYTPAMMADASPQPSDEAHRTSEITPGGHSRQPRFSRLHAAAGADGGNSAEVSPGGPDQRPAHPAAPPSLATTSSSSTASTSSSRSDTDVSPGPGFSAAKLSVSPSLTVAYITQSIQPQHANTLGITFGGQVMSWMEQCAYISASRLRAPHLLTAAIDDLTFVRPTCVGDILYVTAQVTAIFGSSLEVQVSVHGEDPHVGELFHCADGYVTLVTVAAEDGAQGCGGTPVRLPFTLDPVTPAEVLQARGAIQRRDERLKLRSRLAEKQPLAAGLSSQCTDEDE